MEPFRDERFDDFDTETDTDLDDPDDFDPDDAGDEPYDPDDDAGSDLATTCSACSNPIAETFYLVGDTPICPDCRDEGTALLVGGSRFKRSLKALGLGMLAGAVGAGIYCAILKATDTHFGLIAIVVGLLVGVAVRKGSGGRGGWFYQLMAIFLTYTAMVAIYIPDIVEQFANGAQAQAQANPAQAQKFQAEIARATPLQRVGRLALALVVVGGIIMICAYAMPILIAFHGGGFFLVILAFGLWEAWKLNRRAPSPFQGPYRLETDL